MGGPSHDPDPNKAIPSHPEFVTPPTSPTATALPPSFNLATTSPGGFPQQRRPPLEASLSSLTSSTLERLPPSPTHSLSSLSNNDDEDDLPPAPEPSGARRALRDLAAMCVGGAKRVLPGAHTHLQPPSHTTGHASPEPRPSSESNPERDPNVQRDLVQNGRTVLRPPTTGRWWSPLQSFGPPQIKIKVGERESAPFAREVEVKGWQIVGGKSWDGSPKVGAYVVYEIEISLRSSSTVSILRRYTEFVKLREALKKSFPQLRKTIPPLPGKNHMSKFQPEFLEERRPRLQRFLRTVMLHPEMGVGGDDSVVGRWVLGTPTKK